MGSQHGQRYRQIVCRIEELLQNDRGEQLHVDDLCRAAGVSERTLRNAFRKIHGVSPYRYLRGFRMTQARQALLSAGSRHGTVTEVAMQFGFLELGRFSVDYRSAFGECPSATLRRAMERRGSDMARLRSPSKPWNLRNTHTPPSGTPLEDWRRSV